jgi:MOSC domain-containing protein YiiM
MTTLAQDDLGFAPGILGALHKTNESCLGVYARVVSEGTIWVGDDVVLCC